MIGLRLVIAGVEAKIMKSLEEVLKVAGCIIVGRADDEFGAIKVIRTTQPEFIILDGGNSFIEVAKTVEENMLAPLIMLTDSETRQLLAPVREHWDFDCLDKPVKPEALKIAVMVGLEKFRRKTEILREQEKIHSRTTTRNIVEKAKLILMKNLGISEVQALHKIQMLGHDEGVSIRSMAERIITEKQLA